MFETICVIDGKDHRLTFWKSPIPDGEYVKGTLFIETPMEYEYYNYFDPTRSPQVEHSQMPGDYLISIMQAVNDYKNPEDQPTFF